MINSMDADKHSNEELIAVRKNRFERPTAHSLIQLFAAADNFSVVSLCDCYDQTRRILLSFLGVECAFLQKTEACHCLGAMAHTQ